MAQATDHSAELPLNIPELLARVDNDTELLRELLQLFKEECPPLCGHSRMLSQGRR
jgi:hypothetical protein